MFFLGCSGWYYKHWIGNFYPKDLKKRKWLEFYAERFNTVEVNSTFYNFPKEKILKSWYKRSPDNFTFTLKANRLITHENKLQGVENLVNTFYQRSKILKEKLGTILFQTPPSLKKDLDLLSNFIKLIDENFENVFEFRHKSWYSEEVYDLLKENKIGYCVVSCPSLPMEFEVTSNISYVRLHGVENWYRYDYSEKELRELAEKLRKLEGKTEKVYCYFNNDFEGNAPKNCKRLKEILL